MVEKIRVGINGFGRIGRKIARLALEKDHIEITGINALSSPEQMVYLLKNDSVHGRLKEEVKLEGQFLKVGRFKIHLSSERDPSCLPNSTLLLFMNVQAYLQIEKKLYCILKLEHKKF